MKNVSFYVPGLIRRAREKIFKSAIQFYRSHEDEIGASYAHYSAVENGTKFPEIGLAVRLARILKIDLKLMCHAWARDQMPDTETRSFFGPTPSEVEDRTANKEQTIVLEDYYVMNEAQIPFLKAHPHAWVAINYVMAIGEIRKITEKDLAKAISVPAYEVKVIVNWMREQGILTLDGDRLHLKRRYMHLPNDEDFRVVREANFVNTAQALARTITPELIRTKQAYRTTFHRRVNKVQARDIVRRISELLAYAGDLEDDGDDFVALVLGFGPRL